MLAFLTSTRIGRDIAMAIFLSVCFGAAWAYFAHTYYQHGYAAAEAKQAQISAQRAAAAADLLKRARIAQQAALDQQAAIDAAFAATTKAINKQGGGNAPLDPFLSNAAGQLWPQAKQ